MLKDAQGLEVTTDSSEAIASINRFIDQILSYSNNPDAIFQAIEADPTSVLANAYAAVMAGVDSLDASTGEVRRFEANPDDPNALPVPGVMSAQVGVG